MFIFIKILRFDKVNINILKPKRHNNHILENESNKFFNNNIPVSWFLDKPDNDYGIDYITNIVTNNEVTGLNFSVQLKSKESDSNKETVNIQFKTSTLNFYNSRLEPILIIAFVKSDKEAYWIWFDDINFSSEYLLNKETTYLKIPKTNKLTEIDWNLVTKKVQKVFSIKSMIESFSKLDYGSLEKTEILAWKHYFSKEYNDAIFYFKKVLDNKPILNEAILLQGIAHSLYEMYNYNEAILYINRCLEIDKSENTYLTKACILAEQGISLSSKSKLLSAKQIFKQFLDLGYNQAIYHYNYANTLQNLSEYENAVIHFEIAISLNPYYAEAWKNLGTVYYHLDNTAKELECYDNALKINPKLYQALFSKGVTYVFKLERIDEGLQLMLDSMSMNEQDLITTFPQGYYCIGYAYYRLNNLKEALIYIDEGLDYIPEDIRLINLKLMIIEQNVSINAVEPKNFNPFLNILLDLKDHRAIYYLAINNDLEETQIINLCKENLFLFTDITIENLSESEISMKNSIIFLKYYETYKQFRSNHSVLSYLENLDSEHYEIPQSFFSLFELVGAISFSNVIEYILNSFQPDSYEVSEIVRNSLSKLPLLLKELLPKSVSDLPNNKKINILSSLIIEYRLVIIKEISRQQGHLLGLFSLPNITNSDEEKILPESFFDEIIDSIIEITNDKLQLLPKE